MKIRKIFCVLVLVVCIIVPSVLAFPGGFQNPGIYAKRSNSGHNEDINITEITATPTILGPIPEECKPYTDAAEMQGGLFTLVMLVGLFGAAGVLVVLAVVLA